MALAFEERVKLREAVDDARRRELAVSAAQRDQVPRCPAFALSGRRCCNKPAASGFCHVHERSHTYQVAA